MEPNYGYRHTRGFIVFLIIIFCGWVIVAHSQTSNTGNLVDTNWSNGYQVPELTCWGNEQGTTNCSPGGKPYVRPDGNINFSFSFTELYQARAIADVLPNSGTGLIATGFQFNWMSKNGNGWDDGRQDQLSAYVQMYSKSGQWIEAQSYNLNFKHDWTNFSWSGNFTKERRGSDLGTILYGFAGMDNNYWLGPYGPEITNVSFSLRYQPDPCVVNPLHSTECPGFLAAIATKPIPGVAETTNSYSLSTTTTQSTTTSITPSTAKSVVKLNAQRDALLIESIAQLANQESTTGSPNTTTSSLPVQTLQISRLLQKIDSTAKNESITETVSLDQLLSPPQVNQQVVSTTTASLTPSPNRNSSSNQTQEVDTGSTVQISLVRMPEPTPVVVDQSQSTLLERSIQSSTPTMTPMIQANAANSITPEPPQVESPRPPQVETATVDAPTNTIANALIDRTNPLNDMLNGQQQMAQSGPVFAGPAVKSNTADNDLAGGVSISQIARVPAGFDVYTNLAMREIAFYQPKEIYRGQRTVDNVRALRSLGQDARHQEMIDQQYRR